MTLDEKSKIEKKKENVLKYVEEYHKIPTVYDPVRLSGRQEGLDYKELIDDLKKEKDNDLLDFFNNINKIIDLNNKNNKLYWEIYHRVYSLECEKNGFQFSKGNYDSDINIDKLENLELEKQRVRTELEILRILKNMYIGRMRMLENAERQFNTSPSNNLP